MSLPPRLQKPRPPIQMTWCISCQRYVSVDLLTHARQTHPEVLAVVEAFNAHMALFAEAAA